MNDGRLKKLFSAARHETPPEVSFNFAQSVLAAIRRRKAPRPFSLVDQLGALFPRLAAASLLVIALCAAGEFYFSAAEGTPSNDLNQLTEELIFADNSP